ncbi:phage head morphogenesis protein [Entomomonas moraniae]|nr:minor capsid protein [Entomomonas moraniae]AZS50403.1 phage head morphogenesis protein [Entomomonas moraniae]
MAEKVSHKLTDIALYEAEFEQKNLTKTLGEKFKSIAKTTLISSLAVIPLQVSGSIAGKTVNEAINIIPIESQRLINAIKVSVAQGKSNAEIITSIRGTKANQYTDGILNVSRNSIDSTVRTLIGHTATVAKETLYKANDSAIEGVQWVSTLDRRTTSTCAALDGQIFRQGEGPRPPLHYNCRSVVIPVTRLSRLFSQGTTRASETGQVSGDLTYYSWLQRQSSTFQDQALGPVRGQLFRDGGLSAERFAQLQIDRNFRPITLARMRELEPLAFERAGL